MLNALVVSLADSEANERHVVALAKKLDILLIMNSPEEASLNFEKESLQRCSRCIRNIGGKALRFEVRPRTR